MQEGGIQQVGVTVSTTPGSDHRAYVVDLDTEVVMGGLSIMGVEAQGWRAGQRRTRLLDGHKDEHIGHFLEAIGGGEGAEAEVQAKVKRVEGALQAWSTLPPQAKQEQRKGMAEQLGEVMEMATNLVLQAEADTAAKYEGRTGSR